MRHKIKSERRSAKKQRDQRMGFYIHLAVYLFVNSSLLLALLRLEGDRHSYTGPFFWGIGLFFHFLQVMGSSRAKPSGVLHSGGTAMKAPDAVEELELRPPKKSWSEKDLV